MLRCGIVRKSRSWLGLAASDTITSFRLGGLFSQGNRGPARLSAGPCLLYGTPVLFQHPPLQQPAKCRSSTPSLVVRSMQKSEADLKELWADAYDAWRNVPGHPEKAVYLRPEQGNKALLADKDIPKLPEVVHGAVLFGLTSWNPGGQDAPMEQNLSSYRSIQVDLLALKPSCMWQSFGFDLEGYRENGFTVAFPAEAADSFRSAVVEIAKKYGQGAIYEFREAEPISEGRIVRSTVPALLQEVDADVTMVACSKPNTPGADPDLHFEGSLPWPLE